MKEDFEKPWGIYQAWNTDGKNWILLDSSSSLQKLISDCIEKKHKNMRITKLFNFQVNDSVMNAIPKEIIGSSIWYWYDKTTTKTSGF